MKNITVLYAICQRQINNVTMGKSFAGLREAIFRRLKRELQRNGVCATLKG
jgi:hypothetical protein